jgi:5-methylcytosine-specific restriction endonuclease McrBC GTP-binding regulatory subunit McrB
MVLLDEMNLARVEYYFADFLSHLEERSEWPVIPLFSDTEAQHLMSEAKNFLSLISDVKQKLDDTKAISFLDLLRDDALNAKLHEMCGFGEGESLLKYHAYLRRLFSSYLTTPSRLVFPANVRVIGAINVDETTHYLSPKILDRAHVMRFSSPLLSDWDSIEAEIADFAAFDIDINLPVLLKPENFGVRKPYPQFNRKAKLVNTLIEIVRDYLEPLGIEFGLRTVRQAQNYEEALRTFGASDELILNNIVLHKILPKLMFDGEKIVNGEITRTDILKQFKDKLAQTIKTLHESDEANCMIELDRLLKNAEANDWVFNYWSR